MRPRRWIAVATTLLLVIAVPLRGQDAPPRFDPAKYTTRSEDIRMRDGVTLHTEMLIPAGATMPLPILFRRTPYGVPNATPQMLMGGMKELAEEGYIFVMQDIRGRYRSQGGFVMQRPLREPGSSDIDESTDAYDTIDWLVKNVPNNNGRVGMFGVSYDGWTSAMAMLDPHPALRAVSEQASPADMFLGDDFHHNGAFRLSYGFEYAYMTEATKENSEYKFTPADTYEWYLKVGPLRNIQANVMRDTVLPTWRDFSQHPNYDAFWKRQSMHRSLTRVTVPTLHVAGWWDQEDFYGPVTIYRTLEKRDSLSRNTLVVGPWIHGSWSRGTGAALDSIDFGTPTSTYYRQEIQAPFFAYWLKDLGKSPVKEALVFESGSNTWKAYDAWPAPGATTRSLYFQPGGRLSFTPPTTAANAADSFISDPANPVPYRRRPIEATYASTGSKWYTWLLPGPALHRRPEGRAALDHRPAHRRRGAGRRHHREALREHHRPGRRLGGEADRRLPRHASHACQGARLRADGRERRLPQPLPRELRGAEADGAQHRDPDHGGPAHAGLPLPEGPPDHGAGAEQLVPRHRPQPADVGAEHLRGDRGRFPGPDPLRPPLRLRAVPHRDPDGPSVNCELQ